MRKDIAIMDKISNETIDDLKKVYETTISKLSSLKGQRENLWKQYNRTKNVADKIIIYSDIQGLTEDIKELYQTKKYCEGIETRHNKMQDNLNELENKFVKEKEKIR